MSDSNRKRFRSRSPSDNEQPKQHKSSNSSKGFRIFCHCRHRKGRSRISSMTSASHPNAFTSAAPTSSSTAVTPPSAHIHIRCLIVTQDVSIIIGKGHQRDPREEWGPCTSLRKHPRNLKP
ncbi:hypothetical protein EDB89DRAFT_408628 [Lactarius sanguifluus]|nr:hypothetical protein EDB89DRAFT_408628 [Lactarius sanguifluus]